MIGTVWDPPIAWRKPASGRPWSKRRWDGRFDTCTSRIMPQTTDDWSPALTGHGDFPLLEVLAALHEQKYDRFVSLEWEKKWHPQIGRCRYCRPTVYAVVERALDVPGITTPIGASGPLVRSSDRSAGGESFLNTTTALHFLQSPAGSGEAKACGQQEARLAGNVHRASCLPSSRSITPGGVDPYLCFAKTRSCRGH